MLFNGFHLCFGQTISCSLTHSQIGLTICPYYLQHIPSELIHLLFGNSNDFFVVLFKMLHYILLLLFIVDGDRKSTRLNSSHVAISYAVFCLKKQKTNM